jgi:hypothetical protein
MRQVAERTNEVMVHHLKLVWRPAASLRCAATPGYFRANGFRRVEPGKYVINETFHVAM